MQREFSMKDKIGYTLGDLGCCCTEQFRAMFLSVFYILVLKVNPVHVGIIMLITKVWDAINDPIIGALVDSTKAKNGKKFIPWIKNFSIPAAAIGVLGFINISNWNYGIRLIFILVSYIMYEILHTCVNVPFGSLSSVMTDEVEHRTDLSRYRSLGGTIFMTVIVIAGPLFLYVDNQPVASRFLTLSIICAVVSVIALRITSVWCIERIQVADITAEKVNYLKVIKDISRNRALLGMMLASLTGMLAASIVNGLNTYLFRDYFGNVQLMAVSGMLSILYSIITFVGTKYAANHFGKKEWCMYGAGFAGIVFGVLFFFPITNPILFIVINGICYVGASGMQILVWAMVNDSIDYHELLTGERKEGTVYATYSFVRKLASALSASISSFALAAIGYNVNVAIQTETVKSNIWKAYTGIFAVGYVITVLILYFVYPLTKAKTAEMLEMLAEKRKENAKIN